MGGDKAIKGQSTCLHRCARLIDFSTFLEDMGNGVGEDGVRTLQLTSPRLSFFLPDAVILGPGLPLCVLESRAQTLARNCNYTFNFSARIPTGLWDGLCLHPI